MLSNQTVVSPLRKRADCILIWVLKRGAGVGGGCTGGGGGGLCCVWGEGELSSCWAEGSVGCVYAHISPVTEACSEAAAPSQVFSAPTLSDGGDQVGSTLPLFPFVLLACWARLSRRVEALIPWLFWYHLTSSIKASILSGVLQRRRFCAFKCHKSWLHVVQQVLRGFKSPSFTLESTRPVLREQIRVYPRRYDFQQ